MTKPIKKIKLRNLQNKKDNSNFKQGPKQESPKSSQLVSKDLNVNLNAIRTIFDGASDLIIREFKIGAEKKVPAFAIMLDGLVDKAAINEGLIKALMFAKLDIDENNALALVKESALSIADIKEYNTMKDILDNILSGGSALFIDNSDIALVALIQGWEARDVKEPETEAVVRGPRESFVEPLRTNTALLRRKIKNVNLKFETMKIGKQTQTDVCVAYIKGIVNEKIVQEVKDRLSRIDIASVLESGYIEAFIEDAPYSIFPTVGNSEKPDIVAAKILEGRVAIITDGTPFVLTVPYLFVEAFQSSEDYYSRPFYASFIRLIRWLALITSVFLPALYVAVVSFHQELLPPSLLISIAAAQEGTPFPIVVEALLMQIIYEVLKEAGVRMPRPIGQAVSIVGALVIGEAAVTAGLIGAPMVIVVALTAVTSFITPSIADANVLTRLVMIILAGTSGEFGIMLGIACILVHMCSLRSFGVPYTSPAAPMIPSGLKDTFIRVPLWAMLKRPSVLRAQDTVKVKPGQMPKPPGDETK